MLNHYISDLSEGFELWYAANLAFTAGNGLEILSIIFLNKAHIKKISSVAAIEVFAYLDILLSN